jgi:hypothetical protein
MMKFRRGYLYLALAFLALAAFPGVSGTALASSEVERTEINIGDVSVPADGWEYAYNTVTLTESKGYKITGTSAAGTSGKGVSVAVASGVSVDVLLSDVKIIVNADVTPRSAFALKSGAKATLRLEGYNELKSSSSAPSIEAPKGTELTITSAAGDGSPEGSLNIPSTSNNNAGIGGRSSSDPNIASAGTITINGGTIEVRGGPGAANIGGAAGSTGKVAGEGGNVTINGGVVKTPLEPSSYSGAGIGGGGYNGSGTGGSGGVVVINGGTVEVRGGYYSAGIGGGPSAQCGYIAINGGSVFALGGHGGGAGIGGGATGGSIMITGGKVEVSGYEDGAGIGGSDGVEIEITGGEVYATSGVTGGNAAIGGGPAGAGKVKIRSAGGAKLFRVKTRDSAGIVMADDIYMHKGARMVKALLVDNTGSPPAQPIGHGKDYTGESGGVAIDALELDSADSLPVLPEVIGGVTVRRSGASTAVLAFVSNVGGFYYCGVAAPGEDVPDIGVSGGGAEMREGENEITLSGLSESAAVAYVRVEGDYGLLSETESAIIPAYSEWTGLTSNGVAGFSDTSELTMTFSSDPGPLTSGDVTLTGAGKGELTGEGNVRKLAVSGIGVNNGAAVEVSLRERENHFVTPVRRETAVFREDADVGAPALSGGTASRSGASIAEVRFTSSEDGAYYYAWAEADAQAPNIPMIGGGSGGKAGENVITLYNLSASAKAVYIRMKDEAGNVSQTLKIGIPADESAGSGGDGAGNAAAASDDKTETAQTPPSEGEQASSGSDGEGGAETPVKKSSVIIDTPASPRAEGVHVGQNSRTFGDASDLPDNIAAITKAEGNLVFPRVRAVLGVLDSDSAIDEEYAVPLPVFGTTVPSKGTTGVVTLEMRLDALEGKRVDSIYAVKLRHDGTAAILERAISLRDICPSQFILTDYEGAAFQPGETVKANTDYCVSIAVRDNGPDDSLVDDEGAIIDPAVLVSLSGIRTETGARQDSDGASGGCGSGFAGLAALAVPVAAMRSGKRKRGEEQLR